MVRLSAPDPTDPLGAIAEQHLGTGGKRLRARLALATLEALGEDRERGVAWAAACEILHNATLIHDDVQDGDHTRRGHPTVWARHGAAQAINAGDLMLMLPFLALDHLEVDDAVRWSLSRLLAGCATAVARGQASELALDRPAERTWTEYRAVIAGKTGALFRLPVEGAAILAGRSAAAAAAVGTEFARLGVIFQLQDDVLDLYGEKGRAEAGSDLREGKMTALVIEHLRRAPDDHRWLLGVLAAPREATRSRDVEQAIRRFHRSGALRAVLGRVSAEAAAFEANPALAHEPAARQLGLELIDEIMRPITDLLDQAAGSGEQASATRGAVAR